MTNEKTTVLKAYQTLYEANVDLELLEQAGIACFLGDTNMVSLYPMFNSPFGGIKLYVFDEDIDKALMIINEYHSHEETLD